MLIKNFPTMSHFNSTNNGSKTKCVSCPAFAPFRNFSMHSAISMVYMPVLYSSTSALNYVVASKMENRKKDKKQRAKRYIPARKLFCVIKQ